MSESPLAGASFEKTAKRAADGPGEGLGAALSFASFSLGSKENEEGEELALWTAFRTGLVRTLALPPSITISSLPLPINPSMMIVVVQNPKRRFFVRSIYGS
jgi:hypothetical protein